jgi:hypothetical protein
MVMARKINFAWFQREHYDAIRGLVTDEPMPDSFEEWLETATKRINEMQAIGAIVDKVIIDPQQFTAYCLACGIDHNSATLGAFAVAMGRKQRERSA